MRLSARLTVGWLCFSFAIAIYAADASKEIADALYRAGYTVLNARKASELDASLVELRRLADASERLWAAGPQRESAVKRLRDAGRFLQQWQNYLWAVESNKFDNAIRTLTELMATEQSPIDVPRSEILARARSLEGKDRAQASSYVDSILQNIRSLDDLPTAVAQLRSELNSPNRLQTLVSRVNSLDALCKAYLAFKQGIVTTLPAAYSQGADSHPVVARLRAELLLQVLPRMLGVEQSDPPKAGETVEAYLTRLRAAAIAHKDFELLGRIISAARDISSSVAGSGQSLFNQDYGFFVFWREGQNAERAKRFFDAVLAYRRAMSSATPAIPVEVIGQRLNAIEKEHPDEYKQAIEIMKYGNQDTAQRGSTAPGGLTIPPISSRPTTLQSPSSTALPTP